MTKPLLSFLFSLFAISLQAQIVNFADPYFKSALLYQLPTLDTNGDHEIQVSEALNITEMQLSSDGLGDLTGLEAFTNLQSLGLYGGSFTNLNLSVLVNLRSVVITNTTLSSIDLSGLNQLENLDCSSNAISSLNLSNLNQLQTVNCFTNQMTSLNLTGCSNLTSLICLNNLLSNLDLSSTPNLITLSCGYNSFSTLNLANMTQLKELFCPALPGLSINLPVNNTIETLNINNNSYTSFDFSVYPNIKKIICDNNPFNSLSFSNLSLLEDISCRNLSLSNITFNNLPALKKLNAQDGHLSSINLATCPNLQELTLTNNLLTSLDLSANSNLTVLLCDDNQLPSINTTNLVNLTSLSCVDNPIPSMDFSGLQNLKNLSIGNPLLNQFSNFDQLINLINLSISHTTMPTIDLSALPELNTLNVTLTDFVMLDVSNNPKLRRLSLWQNASLEYLNCNNGNTILGLTTGSSFIQLNPVLSKVCTDPRNISAFTTVLTNPNYNNNVINPLVLSYCSFDPIANYNLVSGNLLYDGDNNGCSLGELNLFNVSMQLSNTTTNQNTFTVGDNFYNHYVTAGNYTLTPHIENAAFFNVSPASVPVSFANNNNNHVSQDFCITPNGIHNDLEVVLIPLNNPAVGFLATYYVVYKNKGNQTLSGNVSLNFDGGRMHVGNASQTIDNATSNSVSWNFNNLHPFETKRIFILFTVNNPSDNPPVNLGDTLTMTASITPVAGDDTPNDNTMTLNQTAVASFDPNDKTCLEGSIITPNQVGDYLHYVVRFQNTGTAPAQNIVVKDILDATKFDMTSFQLTDSSHPAVTRVVNNTVEFIFEGINLPGETADEPNSHGYVAFKVKTKNNLVIGNTIENKANIYFDFNFPVITNTTSTTVALLGTHELENSIVTIAPLPVKDVLHIRATATINRIDLFDIQGRLLQTQESNNTITDLDFSGKTAGIYLLKIYTEKGFKIQKVIKE